MDRWVIKRVLQTLLWIAAFYVVYIAALFILPEPVLELVAWLAIISWLLFLLYAIWWLIKKALKYFSRQ